MRNDSEDLVEVCNKMDATLEKFSSEIDDTMNAHVVYDGMLAPIFRHLLLNRGYFFENTAEVISFVNNNLTATIDHVDGTDGMCHCTDCGDAHNGHDGGIFGDLHKIHYGDDEWLNSLFTEDDLLCNNCLEKRVKKGKDDVS